MKFDMKINTRLEVFESIEELLKEAKERLDWARVLTENVFPRVCEIEPELLEPSVIVMKRIFNLMNNFVDVEKLHKDINKLGSELFGLKADIEELSRIQEVAEEGEIQSEDIRAAMRILEKMELYKGKEKHVVMTLDAIADLMEIAKRQHEREQ